MPYITAEEREKIHEDDFAGPHRSYPIRNEQDVKDAARLIGHAEDPSKVKKKIIRIAKRKGLALPEKWEAERDEPDADSDDSSTKQYPDTLIYYGAEVKSLDDKGRIGGYVIRWGTPQTPDLTAAHDFFTPATDFGNDLKNSPLVIYKHGFDPVLDLRNLVDDTSLKSDDVGVWLEGQMKLADAYEKGVLKMIKDGKIGYSTGCPPHMARPEQANGTNEIKSWHIGEVSFTPSPADPRLLAAACSLKSVMMNSAPELKAMPEGHKRDLSHGAVSGGLSRIHDASYYAIMSQVGDDKLGHDERMSNCKSCYDNMKSTGLKLIDHMLKPSDVTGNVDDASELKSLWQDHARACFKSLQMDDHYSAVRAAVGDLVERFSSLGSLKAQKGARLSAERVGEIVRLREQLDSLVTAHKLPSDQDALINQLTGRLAQASATLAGV